MFRMSGKEWPVQDERNKGNGKNNGGAGQGRRPRLPLFSGGESGIRTRDTLADIPVFETGAFNHSATSPLCLAPAAAGALSPHFNRF